MGSTYASGMAEAVAEGYATMRQAIAAHVMGNFYPALDREYVELAIVALDAAYEGDWHAEVVLPEGLRAVPREAFIGEDGDVVVEAGTLIRILRLDPFTEVDPE
jgi:hypothetical protein